MKILLVALLVAMIAKDASHINDPYIMRGVAQGACFIVGVTWMLMNIGLVSFKKYWPIFGYLLVSLISGLMSPQMEFALIQTGSLISVLVFSIAYFESQNKIQNESINLYFNTSIIAYLLVCVVSILLIKLAPWIVYSRIGDWDNISAGQRFSGLFPAAGMMGAASGLLFGYVLFRRGRWSWKGPALVVSLICLVLTQSRTFWVAAFVTSIFVWWIYKPQAKKMIAVGVFLVMFFVSVIAIFNVSINSSGIEKEVRIGSLSTLSGRLPLWENGIDVFSKSPFLGYGSTMGAYALNKNNKNSRTARSFGHETLHNGYLQTILDLGVFGLFFYISIYLIAIKRIYLYDKNREYGAVLYGVTFMAVGNLGESIVYSASVSHSIVFWVLVVFALYRFSPDSVGQKKGEDEKNIANDSLKKVTGYSILATKKSRLH